MKVSVNTIRQLTGMDIPSVDDLVSRINQQLGGVEEVIDLGSKYKDARVVRVVECEKHPNADKLSVCKVDAGTGELVTVVCGANNVKAGMWAIWLPPSSTVPSTYEDDEPFVLGARELRGVMSNGMLASARELALGDDHDGIVELTVNDLPENKELAAGASFAELFGLDDTIIDIENKMFTHRPDLFGQLGVAREVYAILAASGISQDMSGAAFTEPGWWREVRQSAPADGLELRVFNDAPDKVPRFIAVAYDGVSVGPSPLWLQTTLVRWGSKPINNVVDITNYMMLLAGQPTHAYDYDKLRGGAVGARMARPGETVRLLNDKTYQLQETDIVIADAEGAIGLAGVMGGGDSEVSASTSRVVLEIANFDMYTVRKSSMQHGLFTDAVTRFNKGQSPLQVDRVAERIGQLMSELIGARQASPLYDVPRFDGDTESIHATMAIKPSFINRRLGLELGGQQIASMLRLPGFSVDTTDDSTSLHIKAPFWRTDIQLPEDIVEEVGRLYGYDKLPRELPVRSIRPAPLNQLRVVKQSVRESFAKLGASEVLTYSFVHENLIKRAEQDAGQAFRLSNALSPDLQYYRLSVLPSLLDKVHANIKAGHDEFVIYEIGKAHNKQYHLDDDDGLPREIQMIDAVYASKKPNDQSGATYYYMRSMLDQLASDHGLSLVYNPADTKLDYPLTAPFDLTRSAMVETTDGRFVGMVGELKQSVIRAFKLPAHVAAMTLDSESLANIVASQGSGYRSLSRFPASTQDLSLKVNRDVSYGKLFTVIKTALDGDTDIETDITPVSIYQPADNDSTKTITLRIRAVHYERTLTDADMKALVESASAAAADAVGAIVA